MKLLSIERLIAGLLCEIIVSFFENVRGSRKKEIEIQKVVFLRFGAFLAVV